MDFDSRVALANNTAFNDLRQRCWLRSEFAVLMQGHSPIKRSYSGWLRPEFAVLMQDEHLHRWHGLG